MNSASCTYREDNVPRPQPPEDPAIAGSVLDELKALGESVDSLDTSIAKLIEQLRPVSMDPCTFFSGEVATPYPAPTPSRCAIASKVATVTDQVRSIEKALRGVKLGIG